MKNILLFVFILFGIQLFAQIAPDKYYVQFTDKNNSPYSIDHPEDFLTQRALDRRAQQEIDIVENDIPVNPQYLQGVANAGAQLLNATKWLNGVTIYTTSTSVLDAVMALPYVENIRALKNADHDFEKPFFQKETYGKESMKSTNTRDFDYGQANLQIDQINGIPLHNAGFRGQGMVIAVLDGGFIDADVHPVFDSLWDNNQILGTKDFVNLGGSVFTESEHGKMVLSCMGANSPGQMIGTAPKASFWLLRCEDVKTENVIEEYNWVSAAEFADSVGADVINSSLSYSIYDDPQWTYDYEDLDGNTAVSTIGADIVVSKGILVCNSAGNSGADAFPWNGAPADGDSVLSVGAVRSDNQRAGFSSIGPTADGRIRPVIMALGSNATIAYGDSDIATGSGTSFSSPIIAGMSTCLWQANPEMKVMDIYEAIRESGSMSQSPDNYMGYGIPDFALANSILTTIENKTTSDHKMIRAWPNPFSTYIQVELKLDNAQQFHAEVCNLQGKIFYSTDQQLNGITSTLLTWDWTSLPSGIYFLKVTTSEGTEVARIIKQ